RALVADVRAAEAARVAGLLFEMGYEADIATDARSVLIFTTRSPDYELILLDMTLAAPTAGQLIQQLRRDARTANVPIGLICDSDDLDRAGVLSRRETLTMPIVRPVNPVTKEPDGPSFYQGKIYNFIDVSGKTGLLPNPKLWRRSAPPIGPREALEFQSNQLLSKAGQSTVGLDERKAQAMQALDWLGELSSHAGGYYDLRNVEEAAGVALSTPDLSEKAGQVLANLGTNRAQRALADRASRSTLPLAARQAAAKAFGDSVTRYGTLLTTGEIMSQYDRYNQSATLDKETQAVLASILDSIEERAKRSQAAAAREASPPEKAVP
ncbi:MAG TPA: hypothetical protein VH107_06960, partial [Lacipirellulaceae bacterium]|nr:hypothetical protein [Lacipirellulaceae bacterium]